MLFAARVTDIHRVVALIASLLVAGGVHLVKSAAARPAVSATTGGVANVLVTIAEDILATILAIVIPVAVAALTVLLTAFVICLLWRRARRCTQAPRP